MKSLTCSVLAAVLFLNVSTAFATSLPAVERQLKSIESQKIQLAAEISKTEDALTRKVLVEGQNSNSSQKDYETHASFHMALRIEGLITTLGIMAATTFHGVETPAMADGSLLHKGYLDARGARNILHTRTLQLEQLLAEVVKTSSDKKPLVDLIRQYKHLLANVENSLVELTQVKEFDATLRLAVERKIKGSVEYAQKLTAIEASAANWTPEKSKELLKVIKEQKSFFAKLARQISPKILPLYRQALRIQNGKLYSYMVIGAGVMSGIATLVIGQWNFDSSGLTEKSASDLGSDLMKKMNEYLTLDERTLELYFEVQGQKN